MILAAHQPHYLPWLGYLDKMAKADTFVVMDDLQYESQNFQNRQRLKLNDGPHWFTVPLVRGSQADRICDKRIDNTGLGGRHHWQQRTWRTLETHYGRAPHFARYAPTLHELFTRRWDSLLELDLHVLSIARDWLGVTTRLVRASELGLTGFKTDRILDMCQKVGAKIYLSGGGGSTSYLQAEQLAGAGVSVMWQRFEHPTYPQRYPDVGFVSHLAFLDLVLNCGPDSAAFVWPAHHHAQAGGHS
ncbi:MAG: WbqC family protein [Deltaproteobacteria bacterium]|nr:WbqC family protein [Deltaproteobacteria bacterium]MDQ3297947.1 WbqC family protein [Myxococcota bacterium]